MEKLKVIEEFGKGSQRRRKVAILLQLSKAPFSGASSGGYS